MRILFASEYYPPFAPGGGEWTTAAWASALARRGHEVTVVTPNYGAAPRESSAGVTIVRVPFPVRLAPGQDAAHWWVHGNLFFYLYFAVCVARAARRARAEIIHAQGKGALVPAWLAARVMGRPVAFTVRDLGLLCPLGACVFFEPWETFDCSTAQYVRKCAPFFLREYGRPAGVLRRVRAWTSLVLAWVDNRLLRQPVLRRVDGVVGVSKGILEIHPSRLVDGGRQHIVHSPPPVGREPSADGAAAERKALGAGDAPLVLYAGKLSLGKGTSVLVDALPSIRRAVPGVRFVFAGKGDFRLPVAPDVDTLGSIPQSRLFALYRAADVVVVPSVWPEPLSRVLIEAMRFGRAVVGSDVGGTPEIVEDGVTGLLVPRNDADALAKAIVALLVDPERRARMGAAAVARAARVFDEDRLVAELLAAYAAAGKRAAA